MQYFEVIKSEFRREKRRNAKPVTSEKMKKVAAAHKIKKTIKELKKMPDEKFFLNLILLLKFF